MSPSNRTARVRAALPTALVSLLAGIAGVAGSYAVTGFTPEFVVAPVATFTSQTMPAPIVTFAITTFGELGDLLNLAAATVLAVGLLALASTGALVLGRRFHTAAPSIGLAVAVCWVAAVAVTGALVPSIGAGLGAGTVVAVGELVAAVRTGGTDLVDARRRSVLGSVAGTLGVGVLGYVLGNRRGTERSTPLDGNAGAVRTVTSSGGGGRADSGDAVGAGGRTAGEDRPSIEDLLALADERSLAVDGLEGLISGDDFYEVDIYNVNPDLSEEGWTLLVTGAVEEELELTYDELRATDAVDRFVTLRCVGERLNGTKMDNALWTGVPIADILDRAGPRGSYVVLRDGDGYFEGFSVEALRTGLLAYGKDGSTLPRGHGFPVRALIPGHWGEINVKWLTEIEIRDEEAAGYWERRGWHGTGPVNTVAKLHVVNRLDDGRLQVGGHAYAGTRGVDRVEVSTDGGETWADARLSDPLPEAYGTDVWRQWAFEYDPPGGEHEVVVRATDGTGTLQPRTEAEAFPRGPSGWVSRTIDPADDAP